MIKVMFKYKIDEVVSFLESHPELTRESDVENLKHYSKIGDAGEGWIWGFVISDEIGSLNYKAMQVQVVGFLELK
jgi:hypothetical protein